jgi:hypothetical protein
MMKTTYLLGFSLLLIAPIYTVLGPEPGNAIYPVTILAAGGVIAAFLIGLRISAQWGAQGHLLRALRRNIRPGLHAGLFSCPSMASAANSTRLMNYAVMNKPALPKIYPTQP